MTVGRCHKVARVHPAEGKEQWWIFTPDDEVHERSLVVLRGRKKSTQRTYAYSLVDHLNFLEVHGLDETQVRFDHLVRYMAGITGSADAGVFGLAWRDPSKKPLGVDAANNVAMVLRVYYEGLAVAGVKIDPRLLVKLEGRLTPVRGQEDRWIRSNPLSAGTSSHRPRMVPDEVIEVLLERPGVLLRTRDRMIVIWLKDSGIRVGGLCGLRFCDLHLQPPYECNQRTDPHIHIIPRDDNPNGAAAKSYDKTSYEGPDGVTINGVIRMSSPQMISSYYACLLDDYLPIEPLVDHDQVLVNFAVGHMGTAIKTSRIRKMLREACGRAGLPGHVVPHAFRHRAASDLYAASDFNAQFVADEFGWKDRKMVTTRYGRSANRHAAGHIQRAWQASATDDPVAHLQP